jgi:hypothetical protein
MMRRFVKVNAIKPLRLGLLFLALVVAGCALVAVERPYRCVPLSGGEAFEITCRWENGQRVGDCSCPDGYTLTDYRPEGPPSGESNPPPRRSGTPA